MWCFSLWRCDDAFQETKENLLYISPNFDKMGRYGHCMWAIAKFYISIKAKFCEWEFKWKLQNVVVVVHTEIQTIEKKNQRQRMNSNQQSSNNKMEWWKKKKTFECSFRIIVTYDTQFNTAEEKKTTTHTIHTKEVILCVSKTFVNFCKVKGHTRRQ